MRRDCTFHRLNRQKVASRAAAAMTLALSLLGGGCVESTIAAAGVTAGFGLAQGQAESFIRGELKSARLVPIADARVAVVHALNELQLQILSQSEAQYEGYYRCKAAGGREIKVYLQTDSPVMTRFAIRVGMMGDSAVSRLVMARIDAALGDTAASSMPMRD